MTDEQKPAETAPIHAALIGPVTEIGTSLFGDSRFGYIRMANGSTAMYSREQWRAIAEAVNKVTLVLMPPQGGMQ